MGFAAFYVEAGLLLWCAFALAALVTAPRQLRRRLVLRATVASVCALGLGAWLYQVWFLDAGLVAACARGDAAEARMLLERGANPNSASEDGTPAVVLAEEDPELVDLLLRHGASSSGQSWRPPGQLPARRSTLDMAQSPALAAAH